MTKIKSLNNSFEKNKIDEKKLEEVSGGCSPVCTALCICIGPYCGTLTPYIPGFSC